MVSVVIRPYGTCGEGRPWVPVLKCRAIFSASLRDAFGVARLSLIRVGGTGQTLGRGEAPVLRAAAGTKG